MHIHENLKKEEEVNNNKLESMRQLKRKWRKLKKNMKFYKMKRKKKLKLKKSMKILGPLHWTSQVGNYPPLQGMKKSPRKLKCDLGRTFKYLNQNQEQGAHYVL